MKNCAQMLNELLHSLQPYPNMRFMLFLQEYGECEKVIVDFCKTKEHELLAYDLNPPKAQISFAGFKRVKYDPNKKRYNIHSRLYDYIFIFAALDYEQLNILSKKLFTAMSNGARLYIGLKNPNVRLLDTLEEDLTSSYFVSISKIKLNHILMLISAKKMHGWSRP